MRQLLVLTFSLIVMISQAQFHEGTSFRATANFNIVLKGLATNEAGAGLGFDASFFSKHRLQLILETSADRYIGDKVLVFNSRTGEHAKTAVYGLRSGPQFFLTKSVAVAVTYGPSWHKVRDFDYSMNGGFKYSLTGFLGANRNCVVKLFMVDINAAVQHIQYLGLAAGVRF
jgi:hypothetical protein